MCVCARADYSSCLSFLLPCSLFLSVPIPQCPPCHQTDKVTAATIGSHAPDHAPLPAPSPAPAPAPAPAVPAISISPAHPGLEPPQHHHHQLTRRPKDHPTSTPPSCGSAPTMENIIQDDSPLAHLLQGEPPLPPTHSNRHHDDDGYDNDAPPATNRRTRPGQRRRR